MDAGLDAKVTIAAEAMKIIRDDPNNKVPKETLLECYSLYRQGVDGDNTTPKPGMLDIKEGFKWSAWNDKKGLPQVEAKTKFVALVKTIAAKDVADKL